MKKFFITLFVLLLFPALIYYSKDISLGVISGIKICVKTIIPSLYIFTVLSVFCINANLFSELKIIRIISEKLFKLSGSAGCVLLLSLFSGYPVGAKLINELYLKNELDKKTAKRLLCFCINPGPAFVITAIGGCIYNNATIGIIIFFATTLSSLACCFFSRKRFNKSISTRQDTAKYGRCFTNAISTANKTLATICGYIILSSAVVEIISNFNGLKAFSTLLEVSVGVITAAEISVYLVAFLVGFGGFTVHLQVLSNAKDINPSYFKILLWKTLQGFITSSITFILLKLFPQATSTIMINDINLENGSGTPISSITVVLFLITTLAFLQKKLKNYGKRQNNMLL